MFAPECMSWGYSIQFNKYGVSGRILTRRIDRWLPSTEQAMLLATDFLIVAYPPLFSLIVFYYWDDCRSRLKRSLKQASAVAGICFSRPPYLRGEAKWKINVAGRKAATQSMEAKNKVVEGEDGLLPPAPAQEGCLLLVSGLATYGVIKYLGPLRTLRRPSNRDINTSECSIITAGGTITRFRAD
jgi:hypothetical protein